VKAVINYFKDVRLELTKVTWPKREEVIRLTLLVFACSIVVAAYLGALDYGFTKLLEVMVSR
jgi:preprotein translocase subunit SecE